jgi:archaetidylinositol phosphate synthase
MLRLTAIEPPWDQQLARWLIAPLRHTAVTPNHVTTVSLLTGLAAAGLFAAGGALAHLGAVLFALALVLDHADGELARMTGRTSRFGHYYDLVADGVVLTAVFMGIGLGLPIGALDGWAAELGVLAGVSIAIIISLRAEIERRLGKAATRQPNLLGFAVEDVLYLLVPITWAGGLETFIALAGVGAPLYAAWVLWQATRMPAVQSRRS